MLKPALGLLVGAVLAAVPAGAAPSQGGSAYVLLADNSLFRLQLPQGRVVARRALAAKPPLALRTLRDPRHAIAVDRPGHRLFVLVSRPAGKPDSVVVVATPTLAVRARYALQRGVQYRGVLLARTTGLLYAYGARPGGVDPESGFRDHAAVVTVLRAADGAIVGRWTVRAGKAHDWWLYWAALSRDERRLVLSYHGSNAGGGDVLELRGMDFTACAPTSATFERAGCSGYVHGMVEPYRDGFVAATGSSRVIEIDARGEIVRWIRTGLQTHHMDLTLDAAQRTLYGVGPCGKLGGLRAVDLASGGVRRLRPARGSFALCGSRIVRTGDRLLVATGGGVPPYTWARPAVLILDERSGRTLRRIRTRAWVLDVALG